MSVARLWLTVLLLIPASLAGARAVGDQRVPDHPLVGRFEGATLVRDDQRGFDEYPLIIGAIEHRGGLQENPDAVRGLEGRLIRRTYRIVAEHSTLAVLRAHRDRLEEHGFELLFECGGEACGGRTFNHASPGYRVAYGLFGENYREQRYLAARLARDQGDVYVAVQVVRNTSGGGDNRDRLFAQVDVLEVRRQASEVVVLKAGELDERIQSEGKVALRGLYFDTGSARIKSESRPVLAEIAALLKKRSGLNVLVVGHTDNRGGFDYNVDLSRRRAAAVVRALNEHHGVAASRLKAYGVGAVAPAASNATERGRARNRRVELVED